MRSEYHEMWTDSQAQNNGRQSEYSSSNHRTVRAVSGPAVSGRGVDEGTKRALNGRDDRRRAVDGLGRHVDVQRCQDHRFIGGILLGFHRLPPYPDMELPMSRWIAAVVAFSVFTVPAYAADHRTCQLSFSGVVYDVCQDTMERSGDMVEMSDTIPVPGHAYRVVKVRPPLNLAKRAALEGRGLTILDYLPHDAYLVRASDSTEALSGLSDVTWIGDYRPAFKIGPVISQFIAAPPDLKSIDVTVALHAEESAERVLAALEDDVATAIRLEQGPQATRLVVSLPPAHLEALVVLAAPLAEVRAINFRPPMRLMNVDADWIHQGNVQSTTPIYDRGIFGCGQIVGYMDSGLDFNHCAFADTVNGDPPVASCTQGAACPAGTPDMAQRKVVLYYKWSASGDTLGDGACNPSTGAGHGSHVGGSIAGDAPGTYADCSGLGDHGDSGDMDGTAPGARLIHQEMGESLDYINSAGGTVYHSVATAYAGGARIHSNSWGGGCCFLGFLCVCSEVAYDALARDADQVVWDNPDMTVLFAAGNDATCCDAPASIGSPGVAKNVVTVGATNHGGSSTGVAFFSSRGWTVDRRTKPDVMAQGNSVVSTASDGSTSGSNCSTCTMDGTSMATPTAAGLAALVRDYLAQGFYPSGKATAEDAVLTPSAALVKGLLINGARDMTGSSGTPPTQDEGWGRITLDDALYFTDENRRLWLVDATTGIDTAESAKVTLAVGASEPLKATLVWSDYPAAINADPALVNDLRLEVATPGGDVLTQKLPGTDPPDPFTDTSTSGYDDVNPVEQIHIANPQAGDYTITVRGINVGMGPQPYALVVTGDVTEIDPTAIFADGFESSDTTAWSEPAR
jgi:hypothetical protein